MTAHLVLTYQKKKSWNIEGYDKMERERVLITGISGFVGSNLAEFLLGRGMEVYGTIRWRSKLDNIRHIQDKVRLIETDIKDAHSMQKTIDDVEPDYVFHLDAARLLEEVGVRH